MSVRPERVEGQTLQTIYRRLKRFFGPQHWWPAQARTDEARRLEIAVGAILTQNTAWSNAARAVAVLRSKSLMHAPRLHELSSRQLAPLIRSSGYFNQKAKKLKSFIGFLCSRHSGRMERMRSREFLALREGLLGLSGIGPETADSILLYALDKPVFVVDAYTRRVLARHSFIPWEASYDQIQALFSKHLPARVPLYNEYHALFVAVGKEFCRKRRPLCRRCPLREVSRIQLESQAGCDPA